MYDKYRYKIRESGFPVAAVEREKKVVVSKDTRFAVTDHNYTKTGIIPNVIMPFLPNHHATELYHILLDKELINKPILCLYID
ncbi:5221_t:CDS:2, partial [Funneliformis geosporum]